MLVVQELIDNKHDKVHRYDGPQQADDSPVIDVGVELLL